MVQRPLLYLGEINNSQELAWRKSIAILEEGALQPRTLSLFPEDRCEGLLPDASIAEPSASCRRTAKPAPASPLQVVAFRAVDYNDLVRAGYRRTSA